MGQYVFRLPDVGEGTAEAEIAQWHVAVGDTVQEDQLLVSVMTDKATVEIESPVAGTVLSVTGVPGEKLAVGSELVVLAVEGEGTVVATAPSEARRAATPLPEATPTVTKPEVAAPALAKAKRAPTPAEKPRTPSKLGFATRAAGERPPASPAVRRKAREVGIELQFVPGTGPAGRITPQDLDAYIASGGQVLGTSIAPAGLIEKHGVEEIKVIGLRRIIAERMQDSKRRIPHFCYIEEVDVTALEDLRSYLNATRLPEQPKLTLLPFLMRAIVKALSAYPQINARFHDDEGVVRRHEAVHIGIATQTPAGLIVPVVRHSEARDIWDCATEVARLANAAREGKAARDELSGSTITITSLGVLGGLASTPVINYPEVAIIGVNKIAERPMARDRQIVVRKMMNLSSSFDHRVVDGVDAAEFVQCIRERLEQPAAIFMD